MRHFILLFSILFFVQAGIAQKTKGSDPVYDTLRTAPDPEGTPVKIAFQKGPSHNHPLMAIWVEDLDSSYVATLYVAESIGKSVFNYATNRGGKWAPGEIRRPAALPYWGHKYGFRAEDGYYIPSVDHPVPDAITGATPKRDFVIYSLIPETVNRQVRILFEINQSWDWNEYWTNDKFPDDEQYKTSSQPAVVYETVIDLDEKEKVYTMEAIGHSHYSGKDGRLYTNLSTLTTAMEIVGKITVQLGQ